MTLRITASMYHLLDNLDLSIEARCSALDQRHVRCQAHLIYMSPCFKVIQSIEDQVECLEPVNIEP